MTLKQLENLIEIDQDITDDEYGTYYDKRTIELLLMMNMVLTMINVLLNNYWIVE